MGKLQFLLDKLGTTPDTFLVQLPESEPLRFRYLRGRKAFSSLQKSAELFARSVTELNCPTTWKPFMTSDTDTLVWVCFLGELSEDAEVLDFLHLQHVLPVLFDSILAEVQAALTGRIVEEESSRVDAAKKG